MRDFARLGTVYGVSDVIFDRVGRLRWLLTLFRRVFPVLEAKNLRCKATWCLQQKNSAPRIVQVEVLVVS